MASSRLLLIGLDCAAPRFVFGADAFHLPNLQSLMDRGSWGILQSCHPPITVPAWSVMFSGQDPGVLGIYGFRNRSDRSYTNQYIATSEHVMVDRVWDRLGNAGKHVVVVGVPQTFPVRPVHGRLVSGLLTPDSTVQFTHPAGLREEIVNAVGEYQFDVENFRTNDKDDLLKRIHELMHNRFDTVEYLMKSKPWDFLAMVDMGMDRLHHGFWRFCDDQHPRYEPGNAHESALRDYYSAVDDRIGELLSVCGDDTAVMVVSDHGAKALHGGLRINQWLMDNGYLVLKEPARTPRAFDASIVDWARTRAWSAGGYYGRIYLNVKDREPEGAVDAADYGMVRDELKERIEAMPGPTGEALGNWVVKPEDVYQSVEGVAPDLLVYFGDLHWRAIGTIGHDDGVYAGENDTGPDDANHAFEGLFISSGLEHVPAGEVTNLQITDIASMILGHFG